MKNTIIILVLAVYLVGLISVLIIPQFVLASAESEFYKSLDATAKGTGHDKYKNYELGTMVGKIVKVFLSFLGVIFFGWTIYAGLLWMTSRGNEQDIEKAKNMLKNAAIGLAIIALAYAITAYIGTQIGPG